MARVCEMCPEDSAKRATTFCPADVCYLCSHCDDLVHSANRLARRHFRRSLLNEELDGSSSINDESEMGLVPDVISSHDKQQQQQQQQTVADVSMSFIDEQWMHLNGFKSSNTQDSKIFSKDSDIIDFGTTNTTTTTTTNNGALNFEEVMQYDIGDFDGFNSKLQMQMPALDIENDECIWNSNKLSKNFYSDISSWENIVQDDFEHVVPDVEIKVQPLQPRMALSSSADTTLADELSTMINDQFTSTPIKKEKEECELIDNQDNEENKINKTEAIIMKNENNTSIKSQAEKDADEQAKNLEDRKKRRMEALARFRSKRANRSFTKKVRYECRKQLADSRPRVKGRFVRKIEMALFRKYGAMYREHLDELKNENGQSLTAI